MLLASVCVWGREKDRKCVCVGENINDHVARWVWGRGRGRERMGCRAWWGYLEVTRQRSSDRCDIHWRRKQSACHYFSFFSLSLCRWRCYHVLFPQIWATNNPPPHLFSTSVLEMQIDKHLHKRKKSVGNDCVCVTVGVTPCVWFCVCVWQCVCDSVRVCDRGCVSVCDCVHDSVCVLQVRVPGNSIDYKHNPADDCALSTADITHPGRFTLVRTPIAGLYYNNFIVMVMPFYYQLLYLQAFIDIFYHNLWLIQIHLADYCFC